MPTASTPEKSPPYQTLSSKSRARHDLGWRGLSNFLELLAEICSPTVNWGDCTGLGIGKELLFVLMRNRREFDALVLH
jgi:hypothetical protein